MGLPPDKEDSSISNPNVVKFDFLQARADSDRHRQKYLIFCELIKRGMVRVALDARKRGVRVPEEFSRDHNLQLNFSYEFRVRDFYFDKVGIGGTLKFAGGPFCVKIPWLSVFALQEASSEHAAIFQEDAPKELGFSLLQNSKPPVSESLESDNKKIPLSSLKGRDPATKTHLRLVTEQD